MRSHAVSTRDIGSRRARLRGFCMAIQFSLRVTRVNHAAGDTVNFTLAPRMRRYASSAGDEIGDGSQRIAWSEFRGQSCSIHFVVQPDGAVVVTDLHPGRGCGVSLRRSARAG
jgi:hypothetical protein